MSRSILGAAVKRVEDPRFLTGRGAYLDDREVPGALWLGIVRSPVPHGRILAVDLTESTRLPEVVATFTAADLELAPIAAATPDAPQAARPVLAVERVRFVGEPVAVVAATTREAAEAAAHLAFVDVDPLPAVVTPAAALADDAPLLFPELGTNLVARSAPAPESEDPLVGADVVVGATFHNQRLAAVPLEPSNALAIPDDGHLEWWVSSQNVFIHQAVGAACLGVPRESLRVRVADLGGGFGAKIQPAPEQILVAAVARRLGRPVRWQETRGENLRGMTQGRDQYQDIEIGSDRSGRIVGIRVRLLQNAGAYPHFGAMLPGFTALMATGPYRVPRVRVEWRSVVTNTTPVHAYRGAGRPEATVMLERAIDLLAAELGLDPAEVRRRNLLPPEDFPHVTPTGARYDSGAYERALDRALDLAGYAELRREQRRRRARGSRRRLGIGLSTYVEVTAAEGRREWGSVSVLEDGSAVVRVGTSGHGQGHETAYAQLVAGTLGIPMERIRVVQGDTAEVPRGGGTMASRSLQLGGAAALDAARDVLEKARAIVAHHLEAALDDVLLFEDGRIGVAGVPDVALSWAEIARLAGDPETVPPGMAPGLDAAATIDQGGATYPFGTHVSVAEVDLDTGETRLLRHVAVDDCGRILNPLLVDGQIAGGVAQGIGQALFEEARYDADGNPLTGTLASYLLPTAATMPPMALEHTVTPSPENALGVKGAGEAGTIGATAAVLNAVVDAVADLGVRHIDMPLTPGRVWEAVRAAASPAEVRGEEA